MFNLKPYSAVTREERHYCALLAHALLASEEVRAGFAALANERSQPGFQLEAASLEVYCEPALLRDYWYDLGDAHVYSAQTANARRKIIEWLIQDADGSLDPHVIELNGLFWTNGVGSKLWYPGRWRYDELQAGGLDQLKKVRWAFKAIPDLLLCSRRAALFVEAKVESSQGENPTGYQQYETVKDIARIVAALVPAFRGRTVETATLGLSPEFTFRWAEVGELVAQSELDDFTKMSFERLRTYAPSWSSSRQDDGQPR